MGDLTLHFSKSEFMCKDGTYKEPSCKLLCILEAVRCHYNRSVIITSGYRSPEYNKKIGGAKNSYHMLGRAADIRVDGITNQKIIFDFIARVWPDCGLGWYPKTPNRQVSWVHVDDRSKKTRWQG